MVSIGLSRYHIPSIILILVGIGLLVVGGNLAHDLAVNERTYSIEEFEGQFEERNEGEYDEETDGEVREKDIERELADAHDFPELSPDGQTVVVEALESEDGTITVTGTSNFPEEFYPADEVRSCTHYVQYEGAYYRLSVQTVGPSGPGAGLVASFVYLVVLSLVSLALFVIGSGVVGVFASRPLFPTAVFVGLAYPGGRYALHQIGILATGPTAIDSFVISALLVLLAYAVLLRTNPSVRTERDRSPRNEE